MFVSGGNSAESLTLRFSCQRCSKQSLDSVAQLLVLISAGRQR